MRGLTDDQPVAAAVRSRRLYGYYVGLTGAIAYYSLLLSTVGGPVSGGRHRLTDNKHGTAQASKGMGWRMDHDMTKNPSLAYGASLKLRRGQKDGWAWLHPLACLWNAPRGIRTRLQDGIQTLRLVEARQDAVRKSPAPTSDP